MIAQALVLDDQGDARDWLLRSVRQAFPESQAHAAANLAEARAIVGSVQLDLALIDLGLPDGNGAELIRELAQSQPDCIRVVTTIFRDDTHVFPALRAGAQGYLLKEQTQDQLARLLHRVAEGEPPLSPAIARRLLRAFGAPGEAKADDLTTREEEVLKLIARGYKLADAAAALGLSYRTVEGYVKAIYRKLHVNNRAEATIEAARRGLIEPNL